MISGAHVMIYSANAEADRAFFRDVFEMKTVDAGGGWLIFAVPPTELGIHPAATGGKTDFYLMTPDLDAFEAKMASAGAAVMPAMEEGWGRAVNVTLPSGMTMGVYQPRHAHPH